jgi:hypothetical protein
MLGYDPQRKTRIRFSLVPHQMSKLVDARTTPISEQIAVMNEFYEAGYEGNVPRNQTAAGYRNCFFDAQRAAPSSQYALAS